MVSNPARSACWHRLVMGNHGGSEALVLCVCISGESTAALALARQWAALVPRSAFAVLELDAPLSTASRHQALALIAEEIAASGLSVPHLVLVARAQAASVALDLALSRELAGVGAILIDLPPEAPRHRIDQMGSAFRIVQHHLPETSQGDQTLHALRQAGHDIRTIALPDVPEPTGRAIGAFLVELVARASRHHAIAPAPVPATPSKDFP